MGYSLFVPLFFASIGIAASFKTITEIPFFLVVGFVLIAILSKVLGCASGAFVWRFKAHDALTVGFGMITRGEVVLIAAAIGRQANLLPPALFSVTILIILITAMLTPVLLKLLYWFQPVSPPHPEPEPLDDKVEQVVSPAATPLVPAEAILIEE
jgi:Kef-type K+ transport system membrane component KefB